MSAHFLVASVLCLILMGLVASPSAAQPAGGQERNIVAVVEGVTLTEDDVTAILESRRSAFEDTSDATRARALETLIAETAIEAQTRTEGVELAPQVAASVLDARRQVIFQSFLSSEFEPVRPTSAEIDRYIVENAHFFGDRFEYRFMRLRIAPATATKARVARDVLANLEALSSPTEEDVDAALFDLAVGEVEFGRQLFWGGSETLQESGRARLDAMRDSGSVLDVLESPAGLDAIVLFDARAAPIDPVLLGDQIADRLVQEQFRTHRAKTIGDIAAPYLAAMDQPEVNSENEQPPVAESETEATTMPFSRSDAKIAAFGILAFSTVAGVFLARQWMRAARVLMEQSETGGFGTMSILPFDRLKTARLVGFPIVAILLLFLAGAVWGLPWQTHTLQLIAVGLGGLALALLTTALFFRSQPAATTRPSLFAQLLGLIMLVQIGVSTTSVVI